MLDGNTREPNALDMPQDGSCGGGCGGSAAKGEPCGCKSAGSRGACVVPLFTRRSFTFTNVAASSSLDVMVVRAQPVLDYGEATVRLRVHALTIPANSQLELRATDVAPCADEPQTDFLGSLVGRIAIDSTITAPAMRSTPLTTAFGSHVQFVLRPTQGSAGGTFTADLSADLVLREPTTVDPALVPIGTISAYGGASAPSKWLMCDGTAVSRTTYARLFDVIGIAFGSGDGSTTFNLPTLTDKSPMGAGSTVARGGSAGALTSAHTHGAGSIQADSHTHGVGTIAASSHTHTSAAHSHNLSSNGWALISIDDPNGDVGMKVVTGVSSWADDRQAYAASGGQISTGWTSGTELDGATDSTTPGSTGATQPTMSGSTAGATATCSGTSASASPSVLHPVAGVNFIIYAGI
jgi:microcystin-dependent protein